jgi:hypothetical protein
MAEFYLVPAVSANRQLDDMEKNNGKLPSRKSGTRKQVELAAESTFKIGDAFMIERETTYEEFFMKEGLYKGLSHLIVSGVVQTMDMEYSHVDGYYGLKLYNALYKSSADIEPCAYWRPMHGTWVKQVVLGQYTERVATNSNRGETQYKRLGEKERPAYSLEKEKDTIADYNNKFRKDGLIIGAYFDEKRNKHVEVAVSAVPVLTTKDETDAYEHWEKQLKYTELSVLKYPLKLLPMFHYDPRRWQQYEPAGNVFPIAQVTGKGLYLGFKMYTPQGYRPWDVHRLSIMKDFYLRCSKDHIPIMNHCTPEGAATFEKELFFDFVHLNDTPVEQAQKDAIPRTIWCMGANAENIARKKEYFDEYFVSPNAWKEVLDSRVEGRYLSDLHLCLAHFGGPTPKGMKWNKQIIEMIGSGKYPNLYTDISSSFCSEQFREDFREMLTNPKIREDPKVERLKDHILFGTDWYMTLNYSVIPSVSKNLIQYCRETKAFLDQFDTSLWLKFTQYNPYQFYRLDQQIDRIARNIIWKRQYDKEVIRVLKPIKGDTIDEIEKEAAYIRVANESYVILMETP